MDLNFLEEKLSELPLYAYFYIDPKSLDFSDRVRYICSAECPMYGKTWACPPAVGEVSACRAKCLAYTNCLVLGTIAETDDISDMQETLATRPEHEAITERVEVMLENKRRANELLIERLIDAGFARSISGSTFSIFHSLKLSFFTNENHLHSRRSKSLHRRHEGFLRQILVHQQAHRLVALFAQGLKYSRFHKGRFHLNTLNIALAALVHNHLHQRIINGVRLGA